MAGHNKWSKAGRLKGVLDQNRSSLFTTLANEIAVAASECAGIGALESNDNVQNGRSDPDAPQEVLVRIAD